jgi:hypothetical protein
VISMMTFAGDRALVSPSFGATRDDMTVGNTRRATGDGTRQGNRRDEQGKWGSRRETGQTERES